MIRNFRLSDINDIVAVLKLNNQYDHPYVDGPEAMKRVAACESSLFLVCETDGKVVGLYRGVYDGSRALIHLLSVHPNYQGHGIGTVLVKEIVKRFNEKGAPTVSATVTEESIGFWEKVGFGRTKAFLVENW